MKRLTISLIVLLFCSVAYTQNNCTHLFASRLDTANNLYYVQNKYQESLDTLLLLERLAEDISCTDVLPHILVEQSECYYFLYDVHNALKVCLRAQDIAEKNMDVDTFKLYPLILQNIAVFYSNLGDPVNQIKFYKASLAASIQLDSSDNVHTSRALFGIGMYYSKRSDWEHGIIYIDSALHMAERIENSDMISAAALALSHIYERMGNYLHAINYNKTSLQYAKTAGFKCLALSRIGDNLMSIGDQKEALAYLHRGLNCHLALVDDQHLDIGKSYVNFVNYFIENENLDSALYYVNGAVERFEANRHQIRPKEYLDCLSTKIFVLSEMNRNDAAKAWMNYVLDRSKELNFNSSMLSYYAAKVHFKEKKYAQALRYCQNAFRYENVNYDDVNVLSNPQIYDMTVFDLNLFVLDLKLKCLYNLWKQNKVSKEDFRRNIVDLFTLLKQIRKNFSFRVSRNTFAKKSKTFLDNMIAYLYDFVEQDNQEQDINLMLEMMDSDKDLSMTERLGIANQARANPRIDSLKKVDDELSYQIAYYQTRVAGSKLNEANHARFDSLMNLYINTYEKFQSSVAKKYPVYYNAKNSAECPKIVQVQKDLIDNKELLISFHVTADHLYIFTADTNYIRCHKLNVTQAELSGLAKEFNEQIIARKNNFISSGFALYHLLFDSIPEISHYDELVIIPSGPLLMLPFDALIIDSADLTYLIDRFSIRYTYSLANDYLSRSKQSYAIDKGLIFALDKFSQDSNNVFLPPLPGVKNEVSAIADVFSFKEHWNKKATETNFKKHAAKYPIIHFSTHLIYDSTDVTNSSIVLAADQHNDGLLNYNELYFFSLNAGLVMLGTCNSGRGLVVDGNGLKSIATAFAYAGAPNTIMTRWEIPDVSTAELTTSLYANLNKGITADKALRLAKLKLKNDPSTLYKHPFYWASFNYSGQKVVFRKASNIEIVNRYLMSGFLLAILFWLSLRVWHYFQ